MSIAGKIRRAIKSLGKCIKEACVYAHEAAASMGDKSIRVAFPNFWPDFYGSGSQDFFASPFREKAGFRFRAIKHYKPQIEFFSVFGDSKKIERSQTPCKVFFTGENLNHTCVEYKGNCLDKVDLSLGFDYFDADNWLRFPLWLLYFFFAEQLER